LSAASIAAASAIIVGATFAYFSDSGNSNNNSFAAGTLDLKLSDDTPEADQDNVTASFGGSNLKPGDVISSELRLKNTGTINGSHVDIAIANTNSDGVNPLDKVLQITKLQYDKNGDGDVTDPGEDLLTAGTVVDSGSDGNAYVDLGDLADQDLDDHTLSLTDLNVNHRLVLEVTFDSTAGNQYQGDNVSSNWTVTLQQDASQ